MSHLLTTTHATCGTTGVTSSQENNSRSTTHRRRHATTESVMSTAQMVKQDDKTTAIMERSHPVDDGPGSHQFDGWYCIKLEAGPVCGNCRTPIKFAEPDDNHKVMVWEEMDEDAILKAAQKLKNRTYSPRIIEYKVSFGKCETYEDAVKRGQATWVTP